MYRNTILLLPQISLASRLLIKDDNYARARTRVGSRFSDKSRRLVFFVVYGTDRTNVYQADRGFNTRRDISRIFQASLKAREIRASMLICVYANIPALNNFRNAFLYTTAFL